MKKCMILLAGFPATGKSYMCNLILKKYPQFHTVNPDEIKEKYWDLYGFNNMEEKTELELSIWKEYYTELEELMKKNEFIISDYPFSEKQRPTLEALSNQYQYEVITIRSLGIIKDLYAHSHSRDLKQDRHLGHLVSCYHKGDVLEDRTKADSLVTLEIFTDRCLHKGYDQFQLGDLIAVDASDFDKVDYDGILKQIGTLTDSL